MKIALVSLSSFTDEITRPLLEEIASALELQLFAHYARVWQSAGASVSVYSVLENIPIDNETTPIVIFDTAEQGDFLGWHDLGPNGRSYGRVFWGPIRDNGGTVTRGPVSLSATISHEALEMMGNPYVNFWADMPDGAEEAIELCDRVEADSYVVGGVSLSNFLGPRAFREGDGPYDFMGLLASPWEIRPGGYAIRRRQGEVYNVWGDAVPSWKRTIKQSGSRMRLRHASASHQGV